MRYRPSARPRLLGIGKVPFCPFLWSKSIHYAKRKKKGELISSNPDRASVVNKGFLICRKDTKKLDFVMSCLRNSSNCWFSLVSFSSRLSAVLFSDLIDREKLRKVVFYSQNILKIFFLRKLQTKLGLVSRLQRKRFLWEHSGQSRAGKIAPSCSLG